MNNLTRKICTGLGILALSTVIGSGICYSKETNHLGHGIPDLSNTQVNKLGDRYEDLTDKIEGKETHFDYYLLENPKEDIEYVEIAVASINGKIFAYGVTTKFKQKNEGVPTIEDFYTIFDEDGDGIFETKYTEHETAQKYVEGDMVPEWVLK